MQLNIGIRDLGLGSNINGIVVPEHLRERVTVGLKSTDIYKKAEYDWV